MFRWSAAVRGGVCAYVQVQLLLSLEKHANLFGHDYELCVPHNQFLVYIWPVGF